MINIRVFFSKTGRAKYISHLDVNRCFQRALKRTGLPVWYTQGFNPHMYMTFPLPISLGFESECECMDMRLNEQIPFIEVVDKLNSNMPQGIVFEKAAYPVMDQKEITWADYEITVFYEPSADSDFPQKLKAYLEQTELPVMKKSKRGMNEVDIRPLYELLGYKPENGKVQLTLRCKTGITVNLNPNLIFSNFTQGKIEHLAVKRTAVYNEEMKKFI